MGRHGEAHSVARDVAGITDPPDTDRVEPIRANVEIYRELRQRYADAERRAVSEARPT